MKLAVLFSLLLLGSLVNCSPYTDYARRDASTSEERKALQDIVTWDNNSLMVRGERFFFFSGEFHPWRLPSPGLWLDVFQKIKALGFSGVSFYLMWGLLEGEPGVVRTDGIFALEEFFTAASKAGIYLLARPGPYINSECSGGGFPGWLQRSKGKLRSTSPDFEDPAKTYITHVAKIIAKAQITNGGPIIMVQPDNEYSMCEDGLYGVPSGCLSGEYMKFVEMIYRDAGVVVPFQNNDAFPLGNFFPGSGIGEVDIYGYDYYPLGWGSDDWAGHAQIPWNQYSALVKGLNYTSSPHSVAEFQGGAPDPWGGSGPDACAAMTGRDFESVFYKLNYGFHTTMMNLYMTYGGTNWGNIGYPGGYTSYDVGAAIKEDRMVVREKYSELKLQANFMRASTTFMTAKPLGETTGHFAIGNEITTTSLYGSKSKFYIVRHTGFDSPNVTSYTLRAETSYGNITIPQLGGKLSLHGRDSKIHIADYDVGGINLAYSSAEIFTWKMFGSKRTLILYGGERETHELALPLNIGTPKIPSGIKHSQFGKLQVFQWDVSPTRQVLSFGDNLEIFLLWRNDAYNYWVLDLPAQEPLGLYTSPSRLASDSNSSSVIVKAGYLLRSATVQGSALHLTGDMNATTTVEVVAAPLGCDKEIYFNSKLLRTSRSKDAGKAVATVAYQAPRISLPSLSQSKWAYIDSLPELSLKYNDARWTVCKQKTSNNQARNLTTPTSLYASDYGYHIGSLIYRGHFTANGKETNLFIQTQGGSAFGHSVWLNSEFLGSWTGNASNMNHNQTFTISSKIKKGTEGVIIVLIDHMGLDESFFADELTMFNPRGILHYSLTGHDQSAITWKMTGNIGGEHYYDKSRGPLNEGAMYAERQGFHLPGAPTQHWESRSPLKGIQKAGVGFFSTTFELDLPQGYDIPLTVQLNVNSTPAKSNFRVQLFINGFQFGKYVSNLGPQKSYAIPEGIMNHHGENYIALTLWSLDGKGAKLNSLSLHYAAAIQSSYSKPELVQATNYQQRYQSY